MMHLAESLHHKKIRSYFRTALLACSALAVSAPALAQDSAEDEGGIRDIIVTAQKREQSVQDVPVAVTALDAAALEVNRVTTTADLSALAPNVYVTTLGGGLATPVFAIRGAVSDGTVAGTDKGTGIYIDGVYIGGLSGGGFDLPSVERIEVLRGPQGTLFGRNSTNGAVSITTHNPKGELGLQQQVTLGNYNQLRSATTIHTPSWGPFSALVSYVHDERDGDMKNLGAGQVWDFSHVGDGKLGKRVSPKTLGARNSENIFGALRFAPSDAFDMVYKFDRTVSDYTSPGVGVIAATGTGKTLFDAAVLAGRAAYSTQHRPKAVNNEYTVPSRLKALGHSLTATYRVDDAITIKNILAYREGSVLGFQQFSGMGGLRSATTGNPILRQDTSNSAHHSQWSDELQLNYNSEFLTLTLGGIFFSQRTVDGAAQGLQNNTNLLEVPNFDFSLVDYDSTVAGITPAWPYQNRNKGRSLAGYVQGEFHVLPQLDLVGGLRVTNDRKSGVSTLFSTNPVLRGPVSFSYNDTRSTYLLGANFKPTDDILIYAKYSTGYISGGQVATIAFIPETVKAWEGGIKADLLDRRLRVNAAVFDSKYKDLQGTTSGSRLAKDANDPANALGAVITRQGNLHSRGFEVEVTAMPVNGLTLDAAYGYAKYDLSDPNPLNCPNNNCPGGYLLTRRPKATANLGLQYDSQPLFADAHLTFRISGNWRDKTAGISRLGGTPENPTVPAGHELIKYSPAGWVVNSRLALRDIDLGVGKIEVAGWVKNLFDSDRIEYPQSQSSLAQTSYEPARTFGLDVTFQY